MKRLGLISLLICLSIAQVGQISGAAMTDRQVFGLATVAAGIPTLAAGGAAALVGSAFGYDCPAAAAAVCLVGGAGLRRAQRDARVLDEQGPAALELHEVPAWAEQAAEDAGLAIPADLVAIMEHAAGELTTHAHALLNGLRMGFAIPFVIGGVYLISKGAAYLISRRA